MFDNNSHMAPEWWKQSNEQMCMNALKQWKKKVYSKINLKEALSPINPLLLPPIEKITQKEINLVIEWDSVRNSVRISVWDSVRNSVLNSVRISVWISVWDSVGNSVLNSVRISVWDSVGNSVWDSVFAYIGSLFKFHRISWKYTEKIKTKGYPFDSAVKLWKMGLVPSFDGITWRLHTGKDAHVVWQCKKEDLKKCKA
jgi:hypothetical protein